MTRRSWFAGPLALALALMLGLSTSASTAEKGERGGRHPQIRAAMHALNQAARHLGRAEHHFGGHRGKALELVKQAEQELREALEYARAHPEEGDKAPGKPGQPPK